MNTVDIDESARRRFEAAWAAGEKAPLEQFLPPSDSSLYLPTLEELALIELELSWKLRADEQTCPHVEDYLARFPQLGEPNRLVRLVQQEYNVRQRWGDRPSLDEFARRFPQLPLHFTETLPPESVRSEAATQQPTSQATLPPSMGHVLVEQLAPGDAMEPRYTLTRLHAEGGLGRVWVARDGSLNREVALKELKPQQARHPEAWRRFLKEAQITGQLEHPNIVPVYELGRRPDDEQPFYTMRFVRGQTLRDACAEFHMKRRARLADALALPRLLNSFVNVCNALSYAHSRGVVHRDLKPDNVILGGFGEVLVLDWGLAKLAGEPDDQVAKIDVTPSARIGATTAGNVLGTPAYMAPEQAEGRIDRMDARTDIYGLGAILFEILTGQPPHRGEAISELLERIATGPTPRVRDVESWAPRALEAICAKAMERERESRYASAAELGDEVQRYLADQPVRAFREGFTARAGRYLRKHRVWAQAAAASLLLITGVSIVASVLINRQREMAETARNDEQQQRQVAEKAQQDTADALVRETQALKQTERQLRRATSDGLASQSQVMFNSTPQLSLLLAAEAAEVMRRKGELETAAARQALYDALSRSGGQVLHSPLVKFQLPPQAPLPPRPEKRVLSPLNSADASAKSDPPIPAPSAPPPPAPKAQPNLQPPAAPPPKIEESPQLELRDEIAIATQMALSADGVWLASIHGKLLPRKGEYVDTPANPRVYLWNLASANPQQSVMFLEGPRNTPWDIEFSPDGKFVLAAADESVYVWSLEAPVKLVPTFTLSPNQVEKRLAANDEACSAIEFDPDGQLLVAVWKSGRIGFWPWTVEGPDAHPRFREQSTLGPLYGRRTLIEFSADGSWMAVASARAVGNSAFDRSLQTAFGNLFGLGETSWKPEVACWKLIDHEPAQSPINLTLPDENLKSLAFNHRGDRLAVGDSEKTIRLWSLDANGPMGEPVEIEHLNQAFGPSGIEGLEFWPDDRWLISTGISDSRIWDIEELKSATVNRGATMLLPGGEHTRYHASTLSLFTASNMNRAVTMQDLFLATAQRQPDVDIETFLGTATLIYGEVGGREFMRISRSDAYEGSIQPGIHLLRGADAELEALALSADGSRMASADGSGQIRVWSLHEYAPFAIPRTVKVGAGDCELIASLAHDARRAIVLRDLVDHSTVHEVELFGGAPPRQLDLEFTDEFRGDQLVWSVNRRWLAGVSNNFEAKPVVWRWDLNATTRPIPASKHEITSASSMGSLSISRNGRWLVARPNWPSQSLSVPPDGFADQADTLTVWDLDSTDVDGSRREITGSAGRTLTAEFSSDSRWLAVGGDDGQARIHDLDSQRVVTTIAPRDEVVTSLAFAPDSRRLAGVTRGGELFISNVADDGKMHSWHTGREASSVNLSWSPDGLWLVSMDENGSVRLWSVGDTSNVTHVLLPMSSENDWVRFSPDGKWLAISGDIDNPLILWDLKATRVAESAIRIPRRGLPYTEAAVFDFTTDSRYLVTGGMATGAAVWPLDIQELLSMAKSIAGRELTDEERLQYLQAVDHSPTRK